MEIHQEEIEMWCLEVIKERNEALADGLNAYEINFLSENSIAPFNRKVDKQSEERIQLYKDHLNNKKEGK